MIPAEFPSRLPATIKAMENDDQPADLTAAELRIAARLIAEVAVTLPEQKKHAIALLDRALSLAPEDEETRQLRESLK